MRQDLSQRFHVTMTFPCACFPRNDSQCVLMCPWRAAKFVPVIARSIHDGTLIETASDYLPHFQCTCAQARCISHSCRGEFIVEIRHSANPGDDRLNILQIWPNMVVKQAALKVHSLHGTVHEFFPEQ